MVLVRAGEFWMGCNPKVDSECRNDEKPGRTVVLDAYSIDVHEVTVAQYAACVTAGACSTPDIDGNCNWGQPGRDEHPVNCVDWNQASGYCKWTGKRLPTEAEWEKAARGGEGRKFPWGNQAASCELAVWGDGSNKDGCGTDSTWPVCSKKAGNAPYGLCDMAGNVWEWAQDAPGKYGSMGNSNPVNNGGSSRVLRGGSWNRDEECDLRTSYRGYYTLKRRSSGIGFRCAVDSGPSSSPATQL